MTKAAMRGTGFAPHGAFGAIGPENPKKCVVHHYEIVM
jgi:hypothetical protein